MNRQKSNEELVEILKTLVKTNPDQRFHQILRNYGFIVDEPSSSGSPTWINEFYSEPDKVLERVKKEIKKHG